MKIMLLSNAIPNSHNLLGGIFEWDQAKALAASGCQVIFAVIDLRSIRHRRRLGMSHYTKEGIEVFSLALPLGAVSLPIKDFVGKKALRRLFTQIEKSAGRPDIIHAHFLDMAVLAADLCSREGIPLVITEHSSAVNVDALPPVNKKRANMAYSSAKKVIAVSSALKGRIYKHTGVEALVIPNILNMPDNPALGTSENRQAVQFISAGSLLEGKGFDVLIKAFSEAEKTMGTARLLIMGGGPEENKLRNLVKELALEDKVTFFGPYVRAQFAEELANADIFALASRGETFGVVYIEALSYGLPIIATRSGGPEDFANESNGILVDVDDVQGLAQAMIDMTENIGRYDKAQIATSTRRQFSPEKIAQRLTEIYENISEERA